MTDETHSQRPAHLGRRPPSTPAKFPAIPGTGVEIVKPPARGKISRVLVDFDGTISYLRDGWQDIMVPLMVEVLEESPGHEPREELERVVIHFVDHLTGKQTIFQMLRLVEEIQRRGGTPRDALEYKVEYHRRLTAHIAQRIEDLRTGRRQPDEFLVPGARRLLEALVNAGIECYLASGTDIEFVREEVQLLGLSEFFGDRVFGALTNYKDYSKDKVIREILSKHNLSGANLLVVGDGYVEIQNGRDVDAATWGIYTAEKNRYHMNENKRGRLFRAGAHLLSKDLTECDAVLRYLEVGC